MSLVSGVGPMHSAAETARTAMAGVREASEALDAERGIPQETARAQTAAQFGHTEKESAGRYWVDQQDGAPKVRFERPTTAASARQPDTADPRAMSLKEAENQNAAQGADHVEPRTPSDAELPSGASAPHRESGEGSDPPEDAEEKKASTTTVNTDDVDREIERLRHKAQELEQASRAAQGEEEKESARRALADAERELAMKDNDAYRRAHAHFS